MRVQTPRSRCLVLDGDPGFEKDVGEVVCREIGRRRVAAERCDDVLHGELGRFETVVRVRHDQKIGP